MGGNHSLKYNLEPRKLSLIKKLQEPVEPRIQYKNGFFTYQSFYWVER